jgi:hypothetical protein
MKLVVKRAAPVLFMVVLVLGIWRWWRSPRNAGAGPDETVQLDSITTNVIVTTVLSPAGVPAGPVAPLLGETILRDYANPNLPPEHDLLLMSRLMDNSLLLVKSAANRPLSANDDWADFLRGRNSARERFLPDDHIALSADGKLVDRWGAPLFFHALGGGRFELRSAGPDKKLWTGDDLHRNADGSFRRGTNLNPESLLPGSY